MAQVEIITSGSGITEAERLQNTVTAANNSGAKLTFAANRTTSGLTDVAGVAGLIADITQSAYKGVLAFFTADNAAPAERMRIDNEGRVGIGTTAPDATLHVNGDEGIHLSAVTSTNSISMGITNGGGEYYVGVASSDGGGLAEPSLPYSLQLQSAGATPVQLGTDNTVRLTIDENGKAGIATQSPSSRLDLSDGALTMKEMTAPSAPASNECVIYAEDNGSGKTRLMVRFPTGSAQQIAIEP